MPRATTCSTLNLLAATGLTISHSLLNVSPVYRNTNIPTRVNRQSKRLFVCSSAWGFLGCMRLGILWECLVILVGQKNTACSWTVIHACSFCAILLSPGDGIIFRPVAQLLGPKGSIELMRRCPPDFYFL